MNRGNAAHQRSHPERLFSPPLSPQKQQNDFGLYTFYVDVFLSFHRLLHVDWFFYWLNDWLTDWLVALFYLVSGKFLQLAERYSNEELRGVSNEWISDSSADFAYSRAPEGYGSDFPPWEVDPEAREEIADKIAEEEPNDERIDFGSRFNTETGGMDSNRLEVISVYGFIVLFIVRHALVVFDVFFVWRLVGPDMVSVLIWINFNLSLFISLEFY